ncbi:hypothetical protein DXT76_19560 [Halobacillus trueperi]|uniref:Uncharacterized protein n=1 Tax=Halobacillus trueperi TaxID=156205 RepID=A0A3D8VD24_9BACI|nr:hypothetical protein [Halobacillus trueperi]RDY67293.1 hypothetical protein DXT76_19560 [Halobacillus trueperi]
MMNINKRLNKLEKLMEEANKPTQEQAVCAYLKALSEPSESMDSLENKYQMVKRYVPKVHHIRAV